MPVLKYLIACSLALCMCVGVSADSRAQTERIKVFIEAEAPGVAEHVYLQRTTRSVFLSRQQQQAYAESLSRDQDVLARRIAPYVLTEHSRLRVALNGYRASVQRDSLAKLRSIPGVKSVTPIRHHTLANVDSVPWVQAPELWESLGDGKGITIAVIDTGIDYLHANFGGAGNTDDYANNDFATLEPGTFPTAKVIGGWDFAGPTYNSREDDEPLPDPDPLDGHGHGSHVSGTAAGLGVEGRIGPGVAKGASLLALKVFSDGGGSTDLTVDAIERALDPNGDGSMDDHVDVINMSLGARFGLPTDPSAVASSHAVRAGVIVVASGGNNGSLPYVTGSPGVSPDVITVAASISGGRRQIALATDLEDAPLMPAIEGAGPVRLTPDIWEGGIAVAASGEDSKPGTACEPLTNAGDVKGKAVMVMRGECLFPIKYQMVQAAGGAAIIVINTSDDVRNLFVMGGIYAEDISIPGLMITSTDGERLLNEIGIDEAPVVRLSSGFVVPTPTDLDDVVASFSSQGPGASTAGFKPDLAAPGRYTVSTMAGSGIEGIQRRGTSMAAPHVAGMAALLRQQYPDLPPASIKALLQNSAEPSQQDGPGTESPEPLSRQGIGVMRGARASALTSRVEPAGVSFGYINPRTSKGAKRMVTLHNMAESDRVFAGRHEAATEMSGVTVECPDRIALDGLESVELAIKIDVDAAQLGTDDGRLSRREASGWCVLDDGRDTLRFGYVAGADGASHAILTDMSNPPALAVAKGSGVTIPRSTARLVNEGPHKAIAHSFVLINSDDPSRPGDIAAFGWRNATLFTQPVFELAVVLKNTWDSPFNKRYFLRLNTDGDEAVERTLYGVDWSRLGFDAGTMITGIDSVEDINDIGSDSNISHWMAEDIDYNDRVIILPFFNTQSGVNALFKPHERQIDVTLMVVDRYDNVSALSGTIDLDNPAASDQGTYVIAPGDGVDARAGQDGQLWLIPTNTDAHQSQILPTVGADADKLSALSSVRPASGAVNKLRSDDLRDRSLNESKLNR